VSGGYVARKLAWGAATILVVVTINFFLFRVLPGDPAQAGNRDPRLRPEQLEQIRIRRGLDRPLLINTDGGDPFDSQFFRYLGLLAQGDLGISFQRREPVADVLGEALINTIWLGIPAQLAAIVLGSILGLVAAWRRGGGTDLGILLFSLFLWSLPAFFLGIVLLFWGSSALGLPTAGSTTVGARYDSIVDQAGDVVSHMILPVTTYALVLLGGYVLILRSSVQDILNQDYVLLARAKGLSTRRIVTGHVLRNAMLPLVTLIALNLGFAVGGAIQIESVFSWPGVGQLMVTSINFRDYPILQGSFLVLAVSVVVAVTLAELVYGVLDPRVRT
jgi:peptide/nickel transport system permease protein